MQDIIQLAERLGKAISESPEAVALREIRDQLASRPDLTGLMTEYQQQAEKIATLEQEAKPVEVADKHKIEALHDKLVAEPFFKKLTEAQMAYVDQMRRVNDALRHHLKETEAGE